MKSLKARPQSIPQGIREKISQTLRKKVNQMTKDVLLYLLMEDKELREKVKSKPST